MRNFTVTLPAPLIREAKVLAARRGVSVSALIREGLEAMIAAHDPVDRFAQELEVMRKGIRLGTKGDITWERDDLYRG